MAAGGTTQKIGKRGELYVLGELLRRNIIPYVPLVDIEGIDAIIRLPDGRHVDIQIKKLEEQKDPRWFQVHNLKAAGDFFVLCVEHDNTVWVIPSLVFEKYATKSNNLYDLNLDGTPRGRKVARKELLAHYKNNWDLLSRSREDLEDLLAMYESLAAPENEATDWEEYKRQRARRVQGQDAQSAG